MLEAGVGIIPPKGPGYSLVGEGEENGCREGTAVSSRFSQDLSTCSHHHSREFPISALDRKLTVNLFLEENPNSLTCSGAS